MTQSPSKPLTVLNITEEEGEELKELIAYLMRLDNAITQAWIKARAFDAAMLSDERDRVKEESVRWTRAVAIGHIDFSLSGYYAEQAAARREQDSQE